MTGPDAPTYAVEVAAGSLRTDDPAAVRFGHRWTPGGVTVRADFTGAHLLHASVAGCVLNDLYREAATLGVDLRGVRVTAEGALDPRTAASTGIRYAVRLDSDASPARVAELLDVVDRVAEIPRAIRAGAPVHRTS